MGVGWLRMVLPNDTLIYRNLSIHIYKFSILKSYKSVSYIKSVHMFFEVPIGIFQQYVLPQTSNLCSLEWLQRYVGRVWRQG